MQTEPIAIDGVAGPVVVTPSFWGRPSITVWGQPVPRTGRQYALPAADGGTVEATVRGGFADAYPTVEVNGVPYRTGPKPPVALQILTMVPILLIAIGGAIGGVIGVLGVAANLSVARTRMSVAGKTFAMIGVIVVAAVVFFAIAAALSAAVGQA
ncbi:MAG: hypothetical protein FWE35_27675 [Streptosporangiales bacterium]|nr:hypothetical protein [Streptosporangiales bacterium]